MGLVATVEPINVNESRVLLYAIGAVIISAIVAILGVCINGSYFTTAPDFPSFCNSLWGVLLDLS